ncbi:MAG: methyltransferase [Treponema sp.]|jgi:hypothetical protein|nr:methyltransferase [Treponema sp.]
MAGGRKGIRKISSEGEDRFDRAPSFPLRAVDPYISKTVPFKFRGIDFSFALSHGLFSSADIDTGTRLLLKVLSKTWDKDLKQGRMPPHTVLDSGCGMGVIGICAAKALEGLSPDNGLPLTVRCQDRDALAEAFTVYNAALNGIKPGVLSAHTETMLEGTGPWDLILSNVPAKAGRSVHEDFIRRAPAMLRTQGRLMLVVVNTLADFFRVGLAECLLAEEQGKTHTVLSCGPAEKAPGVFAGWAGVYLRNSASFSMEKTPYTLDTFYGEAGFDNPDFAIQNAVKLLERLHIDELLQEGRRPQPEDPSQEEGRVKTRREKNLPATGSKSPNRSFEGSLDILIHEPGQGHLPVWLISRLAARAGKDAGPADRLKIRMVLSGRNIIALKASRHNIEKALRNLPVAAALFPVPAIDLGLYAAALSPSGFDLSCPQPAEAERAELPPAYDLVVTFPVPVPMTDRHALCREALTRLLNPGGIAVAGMSVSEARRFDRLKIENCSRLGELKRNGFCALAYIKGIT